MIRTLGNLFSLLDRRARPGLFGLVAGMVVTTILETVGIGIFLPLLQILTNPSTANTLPVIGPMLGQGGDAVILWGCLGVFVFFVIKNAALGFLLLRQNQYIQRLVARFSTDLLALYLARPYTFHLERNSAELITNLRMAVPRVFSRGLLAILQLGLEGLVTLGIVAMLMVVEPLATLAVILLLSLTMATYYLTMRKRLLLWGKVIHAQDKLALLWANQALGSFKQTRLSGRADYFCRAYGDAALTKGETEARSNSQSNYPRLIIEVVGIAGLLAVVVSFILRHQTLEQVIPIVGLFAVAALRLMPAFSRLMSNLSLLREGMPFVDALCLDMADRPANPATHPSGSMPTPARIDVQNLGFRYPGAERPSVDGVSLSIIRGQAVALVGRSGAGKSTLVDLILGLLDPDSGVILADGQDIRANLAGWQRQIGYVPQHIYLLDDTLARNVALGLPDGEIDCDRLRQALSMAQLDELVAALPQGVDTVIGEQGARLSGGQRQRVGIARALYDNPSILILDEATSALDNATEREITATIAGLHALKTVIVIAHRISTVRQCDHLVLLEHGRIAAQGDFQTLLATNPTFGALALTEGEAPTR